MVGNPETIQKRGSGKSGSSGPVTWEDDQVAGEGKFITKLASVCVPDTFQLGAILPFFAFLASRKINKLRVFNTSEYSDSPRLHDTKPSVINRLRTFFVRLRYRYVPIVFWYWRRGNW